MRILLTFDDTLYGIKCSIFMPVLMKKQPLML